MSKKTKRKILLLDIETSPIIAHVWGLWENNVALNQIEQDWHVLSWAAKWLDDPDNKVMYQDQRNQKDISNDKKLLEGIWKLIDESDILITQNGKKFDIKKLNARFIINGIKPPSSFRHIDTKQIASSKFAFTSNKLEYMAETLGVKYKKLKHKEFPGHTLWVECLKGNIKAWKEMEAYNKVDVLTLQEVFKKLYPWDNSIDMNVYAEDLNTACGACGSLELKKWGYRYTNTGKYQRYKCADCGAEHKSKKNLLTKEKKKALIKE